VRLGPVSKSLAALGLVAAAGVVTSARADEGVALSIPLTPVGDPALTVHSPEVRGHRTLRASLLFDYAASPLVITTPKQEQDAVVSRQAWLVARASFAISHRYLVALDLPASVYAAADRALEPTPGVVSPSSFGLGDLSVTGRVTVLGRPGDAALLGASATLFAPTGSRSAYASDGAFRARLVASVGGGTDRFYWAVDGGVHLRPAHEWSGVVPQRTGSSLVAGAAAGYVVDAASKLTVGPEASLTSVFANDASLFDPRSTGLLVLLGFRYRPADAWVVGVSGGPSVGQSAGSADFRTMAFVAFSPEKEPPPPDRDSDRVPDATDACPELAGVPSSDPVMDGCPDLPRDADGDAVPDSFDACPGEAGIPTGDRRTHGCPPSVDTDGDSIVDRVDACPAVAGVRSSEPAHHGCPPPRAEVASEKIAISEQVQFETGTAVLRPDSDPVLSDVARILKAHPEIERVQIQGHTDDKGTDEYNRELSQRRAESVLRWLVEHGVAAGRLEAKGMGRSHPIADNATEEGRAKNRRVEFLISKSAPAGGGESR
jgi:outer membrane protein OmpA-like peptidoglycan-associated protein